MQATTRHVDMLVLGGGPAGQNAAITAAKAGKKVLLVDASARIGGACVKQGTIPSKTLRETVMAVMNCRRRTDGLVEVALDDQVQVDSLMSRKDHVIAEHERFIEQQLRRHDVELQRGKARFVSPTQVQLMAVSGTQMLVSADTLVIATGSRPRTPPNVAVDHATIYDSDSILSLAYVPRSLAVYGAGVIASEYAAIFANIGVEVVMIDKSEQPVSFLDRELTARFVTRFEAAGGRFVPRAEVRSAEWDGVESVVTTLKSGEVIRTEKALCALGRLANVDGLNLAEAGVSLTERGLVAVDAHCRTSQPHIYAVGDVIGPPSLAATSMEQGRRAATHALGMEPGVGSDLIPVGVYTIPEMACVGMSEAEAVTRFGSVLIGRADFGEVARGHIAACEDGFLKLLAEPVTRRVVGVHVIGESAAELVHVGQMAILANMTADTLISTTFNFPTLAEAYRIAALDLVSHLTPVLSANVEREERATA